jgi:hypothetical protein
LDETRNLRFFGALDIKYTIFLEYIGKVRIGKFDQADL